MPTTVSAVLVLALALFPGLPGDVIYRQLVGASWRERDWEAVIRLVGISIVGLMLYTISADVAGWPLPVYVFPNSFRSGLITPESLTKAVFLPYAGHFLGSGVAGAGAAFLRLGLNRFAPQFASFPDAWYSFVKQYVPGNFVTVGLNTGDHYAGILADADLEGPLAQRDVVLEEPAVWKANEGNYLALPYRYLFIPGNLLASVAVYDSTDIDRLTKVGEFVFQATDRPAHE